MIHQSSLFVEALLINAKYFINKGWIQDTCTLNIKTNWTSYENIYVKELNKNDLDVKKLD